jgi:LuxR family maltose regulon positive regulatory protein
MGTLELEWLGPPRVKADGRPVRLETRKVSALLAVLSVDRRPQSREYLATLPWPEFDSQRAPANLRRALTSLQASLGEGWVQADREAILLTGPGKVCVDIDDALALVREGRAHHPTGSDRLCSSCAGKLGEATRLYRGDFLEGFNLKDCPGFDQWQMGKRDELSREMGWTLERLAEASGEAGRWEEAIGHARRWLSLDELHEPAHRTLMFLYARSGKRGAALRQYEECARVLHKELDQEPDGATRALHERIRLRKLEPQPAPQQAVTPQPATRQPGPRPAAAPSAEQLSTRLRPPPRRPTLVERSRLIALLDEGTRRPLTLVSAPAGFGKTTLLAEWARSCGLPVAWLSLEEADSDGAHFLAGLAAALRRLDPEIGVEASAMLKAMQTPPLRVVADSLLADLARRPAERALVLDDYHLVSRPEVEAYLADLVQRIPEDLHLFIATRVDPGLPLARMRARAQLAEVRADDLRFRPEEAAAFLRQVMGLDLQEGDIALLEQRTEGWPAGLQMAALSLQGKVDRSQFIKSFGGSHRYIMDYLVGEVLEGQPSETQDFLLRTSILDQFRADLCDEVAGHAGSQSILEALDRANLFLVALDEERTWYRYHHLFAELLRHRLATLRKPEEIAELHLRAGRWLEQSADIEGAMRHYLAGEKFGEALRLMNEQQMGILTHGGLGMLMAWRARIPEEAAAQDPRASVMLGSICAWAGRAVEAERHFTRADALLDAAEAQTPSPDAPHGADTARVDPAEARALRGTALVMRAFIADVAGQTPRAVELAQKADELLPAEYVMARTLIPYILSKAYRYQGDLDRAEKLYEEQIRLARAANNIWPYAGAIHELIWVRRLRGQLRDAERILDEFEKEPREPGTAGPIAKTVANRAEIEREHGNLEVAARIAQKAVQDVTRWGLPSDVAACLLTRLRVELSAGQVSAAADDLARIDDLVRTSPVYATMHPLFEAERVRILLARGMLAESLEWLERCRPPEYASPTNRDMIAMSKARVLMAARRYEEARDILGRAAEQAEAGARAGRLLEILVLQARALSEDGGQEPTALAALRRAVDLAEPEGHVRVFLDEGEPVVRLLRRLDPLPEYARKLLDRAS